MWHWLGTSIVLTPFLGGGGVLSYLALVGNVCGIDHLFCWGGALIFGLGKELCGIDHLFWGGALIFGLGRERLWH